MDTNKSTQQETGMVRPKTELSQVYPLL